MHLLQVAKVLDTEITGMTRSNGPIHRAINESDAHHPLAVLTYTLDDACLSYQGVHWPSPSCVNTHPMATTSDRLNNLLFEKHLTSDNQGHAGTHAIGSYIATGCYDCHRADM